MSAEDDVREASTRFYSALNGMLDGDTDSLANVWSHGAEVTTMHPIGGRESGWDEVRGSFEQVGKVASGGHVELRDRSVHVLGDAAYEIGVESGQATMAGERVTIEQRVTNIYRREPGGWKMVHHHTDISPEMVGILRRLQAA